MAPNPSPRKEGKGDLVGYVEEKIGRITVFTGFFVMSFPPGFGCNFGSASLPRHTDLAVVKVP